MTEDIANKLASYLKPYCDRQNWQLVGPAPSLVSKIGKKFRWQILIYGPDSSEIPIPDNKNLWELLPSNVFLLIDINPVEI